MEKAVIALFFLLCPPNTQSLKIPKIHGFPDLINSIPSLQITAIYTEQFERLETECSKPLQRWNYYKLVSYNDYHVIGKQYSSKSCIPVCLSAYVFITINPKPYPW